jgi:predicted benzoate:H+ symporter BenE
MTRVFLWFLLILAGVLLTVGLTNLETTKTAVLIFWALVAVFTSLRLFGRKKSKNDSTA